MKFHLLVLILCFFSVGSLSTAPPFRSLGSFSIKQPGFLNLISIYDSVDKNSSSPWLLISAFTGNPLGPEGFVYAVPNIGAALKNVSGIVPTVVTKYLWPNEVASVPRSVFGDDNWISISGGFLVPGKATGAVSVTKLGGNDTSVIKLSHDKKEYFYHMCTFIDFNNDGLLDILTARATKPLLGAGSGELLWLEQPASNATSNEWKENVLFSGPDVFFRISDVNNDGIMELFAAEFFTSKLVVYAAPNNSISNPASWKSRVIDDTIGPLFDIKLVDLNKDGRLDLLVTDHTDNQTLSGIYAYEIPDDIFNGLFVKHIIFRGFKTTQPGANQASPGSPVTFYPQISSSDGKPYILLGGDGSQKAYLISPNSENIVDWEYTLITIIDVKNTVGQVQVGDVDGDGWSDVFIPDYDGGLVYVYTFAP